MVMLLLLLLLLLVWLNEIEDHCPCLRDSSRSRLPGSRESKHSVLCNDVTLFWFGKRKKNRPGTCS